MDDLELLVGHGPPLLERDPQGVELLRHPANPDPEDQTAFREVVDRRGDLGPGERMAIRHDEHAHPQRDLFGAAGQESQARERLEEGNVGGNDEALIGAVGVRGVDLPGRHDTVRRPDGIVPERLRPPRRIGQDRAGRSARDREKDAEFQGASPSVSAIKSVSLTSTSRTALHRARVFQEPGGLADHRPAQRQRGWSVARSGADQQEP
jgi:hypothetical protein